MRRSQLLLVAALLLVGPRVFAQQPMSPYGEQPMSPYGDEPMPIAPQQLPPVPPPLVAPPPGYYQQQPYGQQYYYQYQQPQPMYAQPPRLFHEEMQPNYGLMVAGLVILGASWSINALSGYLADEWKLAVPVVGPFMETQNVNTGAGYDANRMLVALLVFDGLIETAGAIMLVAGAVTHHKVRVYDRQRVSVVPAVGPGFNGLAAIGRF
jgi:hypothetical protein